MKNIRLLLACLSLIILASCSSDDDYVDNTDAEDPTAPLNLTVIDIIQTSLQLDWDEATDNVGVTGYKVYEDGVFKQSVNGTTTIITDLQPETPYSFYVTAIDAAGNESVASNTVSTNTSPIPLEFKGLLSEMGVFSGGLSALEPEEGVQLYEINSTLFTDYAYKQRLIRLPEGQAMRYNDTDLLPAFPDNTLIAKTFYYNIDDRDPSLGKIIIETRILLKIQGIWMVGNYIWNAAQTEATLQDTGSEVLINYIDSNGDNQNVAYKIPSKQDCFTCHNNTDVTFPIGMKLRSMNFVPTYTGMNQLAFFASNGMLQGVNNPSDISVLPNWEDESLSVETRSRAYMDINCAHCHQPGGSIPGAFNIDFRYETPFEDTQIYVNRNDILARFGSTVPTYMMPQLGRTIVHTEAYAVLEAYIESLD